VPVDPDDGAVDDRGFEVRVIGQALEETLENTLVCPSSKAPEDRVPVAKPLGQIAPGRTRAHQPQHRLDKQPVVDRRAARVAGLARQQRRNPLPLRIAQDVSIQGSPPSIFSLESTFVDQGNPP
jgi:hypothetical protein